MPDRIIKCDEEWQRLLKLPQYEVVRRKGIGQPFTGKYDNLERNSMYTYTNVCCGNELFSSEAKFDSGGWLAELLGANFRICR